MAFGRIRRRRRRRQKKEAQRLAEHEQRQSEYEQAQSIEPQIEDYGKMQQGVQQIYEEEKPMREEQRQERRAEAEEDVNKEFSGLSEEKKRALQDRANQQIGRMQQQQSRAIASRMGSRGVRGGAAEAPQQELNLQTQAIQKDFQGDLTEQDIQESLRKRAAYLALQEGREGKEILREQGLRDFFSGGRDRAAERVRNRFLDRQYGRI